MSPFISAAPNSRSRPVSAAALFLAAALSLPVASLGQTYEVLHAFSADGNGPQSPLLQASDGNFYGTTFEDSAGNCCGTVFKFDPAEKLTTLHAFDLGSAYPTARLIEASDGYFYGTTSSDGVPSHSGPSGGTIFRMDALGNLTTVHTFAGNDGSGLYAGLLQASDGSFYGVAESGGSGDGGVVLD